MLLQDGSALMQVADGSIVGMLGLIGLGLLKERMGTLEVCLPPTT